jgi:hypothetical protein
MKKRLYGNQLKERNERVKKYRLEHPNVTIRGIARIFKLSHVMILNILNGEKAK